MRQIERVRAGKRYELQRDARVRRDHACIEGDVDVAAFNTRLDVSFAEHAGSTSVTVRQTYWNFAGDSKAVIDGASASWTVQMERLDAYLRAWV